jgi:uncharacterized protein
MLKRALLLIVVILAFVVIFDAIFHNRPTEAKVTLGGKTFTVEIADTPVLQQMGLSGHKPLADDEGMIFIFPSPGKYNFWMKDMLFPIDIIWISSKGKVVGFEKSLSPDTYPKTFGPDALSQYVLEVSAGQVEKLNLKIGDKILFKSNA